MWKIRHGDQRQRERREASEVMTTTKGQREVEEKAEGKDDGSESLSASKPAVTVSGNAKGIKARSPILPNVLSAYHPRPFSSLLPFLVTEGLSALGHLAILSKFHRLHPTLAC